MPSLNKVILIGHLDKDPEVKSLANSKVANLRLRTEKQWKDKNTGEERKASEWHSIVCWGDGLVGVVERFLRKDALVYLEGELRTRKYTDNSGNDRYVTEVVLQGPQSKMVMLHIPHSGEKEQARARKPERKEEDRQNHRAGQWEDDLNDDIPW